MVDGATSGSQLRLLTCGSVNDGKSTLIGRILLDTKQLFDDQLGALVRESKTHGTTGADLDLALLVDGLEVEREQGITIDVAHRYAATPRRSFIIADTPGHEQYTRNMVSGASNAELAIILVDARQGMLKQTRRHATICGLLGVRHVVLAVNKMDLVGFRQAVFDGICGEFDTFAGELDFVSVVAVPMSARFGDNVVHRSSIMPWYQGPTLIGHLETVDVSTDLAARPFRMAVQLVTRPNSDFRGYVGTIASGIVRPGDDVVVAASGKASRIVRLVGADGETDHARPGDAVTIVLADEIDVSRGDLLAAPNARPPVADQFAAHLVWMSEQALLPGRQYMMRIGTRWIRATVTQLKYLLNVESHEHLAAGQLGLNDIGVANIATESPIAFDAYAENAATGAFILVDRETNATAAAGMIQHPLRRATNVHPETSLVDTQARAGMKGQKPLCIWFTGLSGSGKSTIAKSLEAKLCRMGRHTHLVDGDNLRHGLNRDLGFTEKDRVENIRRAAEVARLMTDAGLIVICCFISPYKADREVARSLFKSGDFIEVFVDTPLDECIRRDPKGLYAKALKGEIPNFTGIGSPYQRPDNAEVVLPFEHGSEGGLAALEARISRLVAQIIEIVKP
jgi:bifunctional enzyme CysN/CysC